MKNYTAEQILSMTKAGDLFTNDPGICKKEYRDLSKFWHPDTNKSPKSKDVFSKIGELYQAALKDFESGTWEKTNFVRLALNNGTFIEMTYLDKFDFELGVCYITRTKVVYVLNASSAKYVPLMKSGLSRLSYRDKEMEDYFSRFFPQDLKYREIDGTGEKVIIFSKTDDVYPLKNLLQYFNRVGLQNKDKHIAWVITRLLNIAVLFNRSGIVHNGICLENCFVSPHYHTILLYGGWWYSTEVGSKMTGTTKGIYDVMPVTAKTSKTSSFITDLESIKLLGRQLFGNENCRKLAEDTQVPKPIADFLISGSSDDALKELKTWDSVLESAYGERKFIKLEVTPDEMYERRDSHGNA